MANTPPSEVSLEVRLWSRVDVFDIRDPKACALWRGRRIPSGYGTLTGPDGSKRYSHVTAYELTHGPVPKGMVVRHRCPNGPNTSCCRPWSLRRAEAKPARGAGIHTTHHGWAVPAVFPRASIDISCRRHASVRRQLLVAEGQITLGVLKRRRRRSRRRRARAHREPER